MKNFISATLFVAGLVFVQGSISGLLAATPEKSVTNVTSATTLSTAVDYHVTAYGTGTDVISGNGSIDIRHNDAWIFIHGQKPSEVISKYIGKKITINGATTVLNQNCMVAIYRDGTVIIPHGPLSNPLTCYTGENYTGTSQAYALNYNTNLGTMNNKITSFKLKRGYMATLAQRSDGGGYSRVFVAQDNDIEIPLLQAELKGKISFIRVFRWNWTGKRGYSGTDMTVNSALKSSWFYGWDAGNYTRDDREYVVHRHHPGWPGWDEINNKDINVTHLLGYNEPDNTGDSREHYVAPEDVIAAWPEMMNSGLRVGSPANTSVNDHFYTVVNGVKANGQRMDFVVLHCYWGGGTPTWMMSQFKSVYEKTGLPIWITEMNYGANWTTEGGWENKDNPTANDLERQRKWVAELIPLLESADYIERYAIYNWVQNCRKVYDDATGKLTPAGIAYAAPETQLSYNSAKQVVPPIVHVNPDGLSASLGSSANTVILQWTDKNAEMADYMKIERKSGNNAYTVVNQIPTTENTSYSYTDNLPQEGDYTYRISTYFANGEVRYTGESSISSFGNTGSESESLNINETNKLVNADFESTYTAMENSGVASDRAIYIPKGWTARYTSPNENDMSILNSSCLGSSNFSSVPIQNNVYLTRQKWGTSTIELFQVAPMLNAGCYTLTTKGWKSGSGGEGRIWLQTADGKKYSATIPQSTSQWQTLTLNFYYNGVGPVTFGFSAAHTDNGSETIVGFDTFSLSDRTANRSVKELYALLTQMITAGEAQIANGTVSGSLLTSLNSACQTAKKLTASSSRDNLYTAYKNLRDALTALKDPSQTQNIDMTGYLSNPNFEGSYSVMSGSGVTSDRAIYIPEGWTVNYTQRDVNDMSILNNSCLSSNNFSSIQISGNSYLIRQKWGTPTLEFSQQTSSLPAGYYAVSADALKQGSGSNGTIWVQIAGNEKRIATLSQSQTSWQKLNLNFYYSGTGTVTFGFSAIHTSNGSEAFIGFDNFKLTYLGASEDYTSYLVNPAFDTNNGNGWTSPGTVSYNEMEFFNKNFDTYQTISGLPNGSYEVSCQGFYRAGSYTAAASSRTAGTEAFNAYLYANEVSTPLVSIFGAADKNATTGVSTSFGYVPNDMNQAQSYFNKGLYSQNWVVVHVTNNTLKIGIRKSTLISNDWSIFDNFKLRLIAADQSTSASNYGLSVLDNSELTNLESTTNEDPIYIEVRDRTIYASGNKAFEVFTMDGTKISNENPLPNGIYLVRCGSKVVKVLIQ